MTQSSILLQDQEKGIILNDQIFHFKGVNINKNKNQMNFTGSEYVLFYESNRKSTLNDILKCHNIKYIQKLKNLCKEIGKMKSNSHKKKQENSNLTKEENGINVNLNCINTNSLFQNAINNNKNQYQILNYKKIDCDTCVNEYSYENIYNTPSCVFDAIDLVMRGDKKCICINSIPPASRRILRLSGKSSGDIYQFLHCE